jgi:hypothetical protein
MLILALFHYFPCTAYIYTILRFAVAPNVLRSNLQSLEAMVLNVPLLVGLDNQDPYTRNLFSCSMDPQSNWILRIAKEVFEVSLSITEAKSLVTCLLSSSQGLPLDPQVLANYWSRVISMASLTVPLAGSKAAGIRQVEYVPGKTLFTTTLYTFRCCVLCLNGCIFFGVM